jgi:cysteine desulfurase/selenocysteine lyase
MTATARRAPGSNERPRVTPLDVERLRADFPILSNVRVDGKPLVFLDNAASSQMPQQVIDRIVRYRTWEHANIHRGVHYLSETATAAYEHARSMAREFLNAGEDREVIFTSNCTDGINLVAHGYGRKFIGAGDEIILTHLEHHANIVPWQMLCEERGARLRIVPVTDAGELVLDEYERFFNPRTKFVAITHVSNALGTINPVKAMIATAHRHGVPVLVDGAQAAPHMKLDVRDLDCDFYAITGHKIFGPTGIGVLYGKARLLEAMQPFKGGGDMILSVTFEKTTYNHIPHKFEAGTPPIEEVIGLGAAIDYLSAIGIGQIKAHEDELLRYATDRVRDLRGVRIIGTAKEKAAVLSFDVEGIHPHDIGTLLNEDGVAIRTGHHCAQPVMQRFGVPATARASFAFYNTFDEVDALAAGIRKVQKLFG